MHRPIGVYRGKRVFDLAILFASAPITVPLALVAGLAIRIADGTPILFRQERAGLNGQTFHILKFRTMSDARDSGGNLLPDRDRLTIVGRALRKTSTDELPQLLNVLRGEMSIVGPRPLYTRYVPHYTERESTRHRVPPGITGLAQVSGRNSAGWRERLELDAQYVSKPTFALDIAICFKTALKALRSEGVSIIAADSGDPLDVERSYPNKNGLYLRRLYMRDLPIRVEWINHPTIREHMNLPEGITLESTKSWYAANRQDPNRSEFAVEDKKGTVVAMTGLRAETTKGPAEFYIFVKPGSHGRGIGRAATEITIQQAKRSLLCPAVTLTVARANKNAVSIYESMGFQEVGSNEQRLWMRKDLEAKDA